MKFTKAKTLVDVKPGELFVHKVIHTLIVCVRTTRGYRHILAVDERGTQYCADQSVRPVGMHVGMTRLLSKKRLLEYGNEVLDERGQAYLREQLRLAARA
jgi:hypothetical protein